MKVIFVQRGFLGARSVPGLRGVHLERLYLLFEAQIYNSTSPRFYSGFVVFRKHLFWILDCKSRKEEVYTIGPVYLSPKA